MICKKCNKNIPELPENLREGRGNTRYLICSVCGLSHTISYRAASDIECVGIVTETVSNPVTKSPSDLVTETILVGDVVTKPVTNNLTILTYAFVGVGVVVGLLLLIRMFERRNVQPGLNTDRDVKKRGLVLVSEL